MQLPENEVYNYSYDNANNLISQIDPSSNESTSTYDGGNNQIEATDANMQTTASRYFPNGNMDYDTKVISSSDNLLANSSFEKGSSWPENWTKVYEPGKTATYNWEATGKFGGKVVSIKDPTGWA